MSAVTGLRVGLVGAGLMGHAMARCLQGKGRQLTVLAHRNRAPIDDLVSHGAHEALGLGELVQGSDAVILCLPGTPEVENIILREGGLRDCGKKGLIVVDSSTSQPSSTRRLAALFAANGMCFCDAPLGGTPVQALHGELSAIVGCNDDVWPDVEALVETFATRVIRVGLPGRGHEVKLLMNFLSLGYAVLYTEMLALTRSVGIEPATIDAVVRGSRMDCGVYQTYFRYVLERDREAHKFTVRNAHKDLRYLTAMAADSGVPDPMANAIKNYFAAAERAGHADTFVPMLSDLAVPAAATVTRGEAWKESS